MGPSQHMWAGSGGIKPHCHVSIQSIYLTVTPAAFCDTDMAGLTTVPPRLATVPTGSKRGHEYEIHVTVMGLTYA